jgi:hypothetical protein
VVKGSSKFKEAEQHLRSINKHSFADGAKEIMVTMPVTAVFSERVENVNESTFTLYDLGTVNSLNSGAPALVTASIYTSSEGGRMKATLQPKSNLMFGHVYKVKLTSGIVDADGEALSPVEATFTTKVPQLYDLETAQQFEAQGRGDIALYTSPNGHSYVYIAAGTKGLRVLDVTDPTKPVLTHTTGLSTSASIVTDIRGVAVDQQTGVLALTDLITYSTYDLSSTAGGYDSNAVGHVRFYDLTIDPAHVELALWMGQEILSENYSGIPGRVAISGNYAYVAVVMVGIQVVDIEKAKAFSSANAGKAIIGVFDTVYSPNPPTSTYRQPVDITLYKNNRAALTTTSGNFLILDVSNPNFMQLLKAYPQEPPIPTGGYSAIHADAVSDYAYTDESGLLRVIDLAVTSSADGKIYTVDITDPANTMHYGPLKDATGSPLFIFATDITISKTSGLAYLVAADGVYVIDIKDPTSPKLLNIITNAPSELGYNTALIEKDGWVYLANQQKGMATLDLHPNIYVNLKPAPLIVVDDAGRPKQTTTLQYTIIAAKDQTIQKATVVIARDGTPAATLTGSSLTGEGTVALPAGFSFGAGQYTAYAQATLPPSQSLTNAVPEVVTSAKQTLPVAPIKVWTGESPAVLLGEKDEIKFGNGKEDNSRKVYSIELASATATGTCSNVTGTIHVIDNATGKPVQPPTSGTAAYYPSEYPLDVARTADGKCRVTIKTGVAASPEKFIVTNRRKDDPELSLNGIAPLYGGLGKHSLKVVLNNVTNTKNIEPVGVIVLGIDGLRQDMLYSAAEASYYDQHGCGNSTRCFVEPQELNGLCNVLGGRAELTEIPDPLDPTSTIFGPSTCAYEGWENRHIKLPDVTAIFPSITLASWASIFTGKMPGETGILGNEFFARDLSVSADKPSISVPRELNNPPGVISLSSGAFEGYDEFGLLSGLLTSKFFIPIQPDWRVPPIENIENTPQNDPRVLLQDTVYESIAGKRGQPDTGMAGVKSYFSQRGGDPVVVANNHYARGAYWLTWDIEIALGESRILDQASWDKFDDYLGGKYLSYAADSEPYRNKTPFSALTVWYLPGLDHEAHIKGMGIYRDYFKNTTDEKIQKVVARLKGLGEFDNKIFLITADHGHTQMPTELKYPVKIKSQNPVDPTQPPTFYTRWFDAESSCELKLDFKDPAGTGGVNHTKEAEQANNNLHIWELGEVMAFFGKKALGPKELVEPVETTKGITKDTVSADIIAALNGPMAHIYVKGANDWSSTPAIDSILDIAEILRLTLKEGNGLPQEMREKFPRVLNSVEIILVRDGGQYKILNGFDANGAPQYSLVDSLSSPKYIEAKKRIIGMNHEKRSGDIVLLFRDGTDEPVIDRYTSGVACKAWHGSLSRSDSFVPFIVSYPGGNRHELEPIIKKPEVCGSQMACEGNWKATDLIKAIMQTQYTSQ